jgi:hypothetical protein
MDEEEYEESDDIGEGESLTRVDSDDSGELENEDEEVEEDSGEEGLLEAPSVEEEVHFSMSALQIFSKKAHLFSFCNLYCRAAKRVPVALKMVARATTVKATTRSL